MTKRKKNTLKWRNKKENSRVKKGLFSKIKDDVNKKSKIFFTVSKEVLHENIIAENISNAEKSMGKPKSKGKKIFNILFFLFNILLVVAVFYNFAKEQGGILPLSELFASSPKWTYLFIALGLYFVTVLFNTMKFSFLIFSKTRKFRPWFSFKLATIGRYYDHITPLGSGGQPFEIYYLKKNGYSGDIATAIPLAKYMVWQIAFMVICSFILIAYSGNYASSPIVLVCAWIGLILILLLFLFVLFMSITKKVGASIVVGVLKLLHKMHIIKDYKKVLVKVLKFVKQYQYCMKTFAKNPFTIFSVLIASVGSLITNALIAYYIYIAFVPVPQTGWWDIVCKCFMCDLAVCFVPLPGGSGATELSFDSLLGSLFGDKKFWGILIWRFLTFYLYIFQGIIILLIDMIPHKKKKKTQNTENTNNKDTEKTLENT